ncbi:MAG: PEGA domain-containing protein, partial [Myxococcota bacterium]
HIHKAPTPIEELLPPNHDVPPEVISLVQRCLDKDPLRRPCDARELLTLLQADLSRPVFQVPWGTGEFAALMNSSGMTHANALAPASGLSEDDSTPPLGLDLASSPSQLSDAYPYVLHAPPAPKRWGSASAVALLLVILGIVAVAVAVVSTRPEGPSEESLSQTLDEVAALIKQGQWGQAENFIATVEDDLKTHPVLLRRAVEYKASIEIDQLLGRAEDLEQDGKLTSARALYEQVLAREANHELAKERLASLPAPVQLADAIPRGEVRVISPVKGRVTIDGELKGYTPLSVELPAGNHDVLVTADGYRDWKRKVHVGEGDEDVLDVALEISRATVRRSWRARKRPATSSRLKTHSATEADTVPEAKQAEEVAPEAAEPEEPRTEPKSDPLTPALEEDKKKDLLFPIEEGSKKKKGELLLPVN